MKQITLIRHGEAELLGETDFERKLHARGYKQAICCAAFLREKKNIPEIVLSSAAVRAKTTAKFILQELDPSIENIFVEKNLYNASSFTLLHALRELPNQYHTAMLVAHNNGISELANSLLNTYQFHLPTGGVVGITFPIHSWFEIEPGQGRLQFSYTEAWF
jgi:phosphohistidine phosphatase